MGQREGGDCCEVGEMSKCVAKMNLGGGGRSCGQNADKTQTHDICLCVVQHASVVLERLDGGGGRSMLPPNSGGKRAKSAS